MNLEGLIPIAGGIFLMLYAGGRIPANPKNPEKLAEWRRKYAKIVFIIGPIAIIFGLLKLLGIL